MLSLHPGPRTSSSLLFWEGNQEIGGLPAASSFPLFQPLIFCFKIRQHCQLSSFAFRKGCHSGSQGWTQTEGSADRRWEDAAGLLSPREPRSAQESPDDLTSSRLQKLFMFCESRDSRLVGHGHPSHDTTLPPQPLPQTCPKGCKRSPQREWSPCRHQSGDHCHMWQEQELGGPIPMSREG